MDTNEITHLRCRRFSDRLKLQYEYRWRILPPYYGRKLSVRTSHDLKEHRGIAVLPDRTNVPAAHTVP